MGVRVPQRAPKSLYVKAIIYTIGAFLGIAQFNYVPQNCNKVLMIRSGHYDFLPDPRVVPDEFEQWQNKIKVVYTRWHHTNMTDSGPVLVKREIRKEVERFLDENVGCD